MLLPLKWVNQLELSLKIVENVLLFLVILVDEGDIILIKGKVYGWV